MFNQPSFLHCVCEQSEVVNASGDSHSASALFAVAGTLSLESLSIIAHFPNNHLTHQEFDNCPVPNRIPKVNHRDDPNGATESHLSSHAAFLRDSRRPQPDRATNGSGNYADEIPISDRDASEDGWFGSQCESFTEVQTIGVREQHPRGSNRVRTAVDADATSDPSILLHAPHTAPQDNVEPYLQFSDVWLLTEAKRLAETSHNAPSTAAIAIGAELLRRAIHDAQVA